MERGRFDFGKYDMDLLAQRLQQPLPAEQAHARMNSSARLQKMALSWKPNDNTRKSAVLVLLYPHQESVYFPLTLRHVYKGAHSGQVSLPGGRHELSDESLQATALRETQEEIGVNPDEIKIVGQLTELFVPASNFIIQPFVGIIPKQPQFATDAREVAQLFETDIAHLGIDANIKTTKISVAENIQITAPYFDLHSQVVWGATAMILSELDLVWRETFLQR
jgi:8-oxo-dGTP pyrophosphatase MutT (NUDIX family)